jgi:hypothetical protein
LISIFFEWIGDFSGSLQRFEQYLRNIGFRDSTIDSYLGHIKRYLNFAGTDKPNIETATQFRQALHEKRLSRRRRPSRPDFKREGNSGEIQ